MPDYQLSPELDNAILAVSQGDGLRGVLDPAFLDFAKAIGATHVHVGGVPFQYDAFLPDNSDPYPNWSQHTLSLFRVCPPPELAPFMPAAVVERYRETLDRRFAALREYGLRAVFNGLEPMWLPEAVFRAHPEWRGAQCELGRIAKAPYFTPSIDEPAVIELYRQAGRELCERYPEIDILSFFTNDSGAGLQWSSYQYPGINGPTRYRHRGPGERVAGWLGAIRDGAAEAGADLRINLSTFTFPPHETEAIRSKMGDRLYLKGMNGNGESLWAASASPGAGFHQLQVDLPAARAYVRGLQRVFGPTGPRRNLTVGGLTARQVLQAFVENPATGVVAEAETLQRAAAGLVGDDHADTLVRIWDSVDRAMHAMSQVRQRGGVSPLTGATMARWLVRPLVPQPETLSESETAPFREYIFSKAEDKEIADLCNVLGKQVFTGSCAVWMARGALEEAVATLRESADRATAMAIALDGNAASYAELLGARIRAFSCVLEDARLAIMYQHALAIADQPRFGANVWDFDDNVMFDQRALEMRRLARESLDNTAELIRLIETHDEPVIGTAPTRETESVFQFGPNLIEQLRHKMTVMLDHWQDYEELYPTSREQEYEPRLLCRDEEAGA